MRTTFDIPDELYRILKARAAMGGLRVRELVIRYLERGLASPLEGQPRRPRSLPPIMIPKGTHVIPALTREERERLEEEEDLDRHGRSA